jgi:plastocyanin
VRTGPFFDEEIPLMRIILGCISLGLAVAVLSCGSGSNSEEPNPTGCNGQSGGAAGEVEVGNNLFRSAHNGSCNPAVDTIAAGGTMTWTWVNTGASPHSVRSDGTPAFTSSDRLIGAGSTYSFTFTAPGTYQYDCVVHGQQMTGRVVVQ